MGPEWMVTRMGVDVLGGEGYNEASCIMGMSAEGRWITGIRFGTPIRGFVMNTLTAEFRDVPLADGTHPFAMGNDVSDSCGGARNVVRRRQGEDAWLALRLGHGNDDPSGHAV